MSSLSRGLTTSCSVSIKGMTDLLMRTVVLTRPEHRNKRLAQGLKQAGVPCLSAPALQVVPLTREIDATYQPQAYDLVVFVSGAAANFYLQPLYAQPEFQWPVSTKIGTVGVSTKSAAQKLIHERESAGMIQWRHPPALQPHHDSEHLWMVLQPELEQFKKVLIVRGLSGREWLKERFLQAGKEVQVLAVYDRQPDVWSATQADSLRQLLEPGHPGAVFLVSSSESAQAIFDNLHRLDLIELCQKSIFVVIHERIEKRVQSLYASAGFKDRAMMERCVPTYRSMLSALSAAAQDA